jgi:hypothetical protein
MGELILMTVNPKTLEKAKQANSETYEEKQERMERERKEANARVLREYRIKSKTDK